MTKTGRGPAHYHGFEHVEGAYYLALEEAQSRAWTNILATVFDSDQPQEEYPWLGQIPKVIPWRGERTTQELQDDKITIVNDSFEVGITWRLKDWLRDKTGQSEIRAAEMADSTSEHSMDLISALLLANGNAYDNVAFFSGSHSVGGVTIDNDMVTGDGLAGGADPTVAQQSKNLRLALQRLFSFRGDKNRPLHRMAKRFAVMVPTPLWGVSVGAISNDYLDAGATNTLRGIRAQGYEFDLVHNADLDGAPDTFYVSRADARVNPFIYQEEMQNARGLGPESEWSHLNNKVRFDADISCGAGYGRFETIVRCKLS